MTDEQQTRDLIERWAASVHDGDMPALRRGGAAGQFERNLEQRLRLTIGLRKEAARWAVTREHHSLAAATESPEVWPGLG